MGNQLIGKLDLVGSAQWSVIKLGEYYEQSIFSIQPLVKVKVWETSSKSSCKLMYLWMKVLWGKKKWVVNGVYWNTHLPVLPSQHWESKRFTNQLYPDTIQQCRLILSHLRFNVIWMYYIYFSSACSW